MNDFNFLLEPTIVDQIEEPKMREFIGPDLGNVISMTPKKFASSVLNVYEELGGASWLLIEARANPRAFLELLKKMIPTGIQMDDLHGFSIRLIDQFGNKIELETHTDTPGGFPAIEPPPAADGSPVNAVGGDRSRFGHPETATSGNPQDSEAELYKDDEVNIKETFD